MTQFINTTVDRPITDLRHFSSVVRGDPAVLHMWSLVQSKAYRDPTTKLWRIPARKGTVPMSAYTSGVTWATRGNYQVPEFTSAGGSEGKFNAVVPNPGNVISVLLNARVGSDFSEAWSLNWADMSLWGIPRRTANWKSIAVNGVAVDLGPPAPTGEWVPTAFVINLGTGEIAANVGTGAFTAVSAVSGVAPKADSTVTLMVGQGSPSQQFTGGRISDIAVIAGDVRTMPTLLTAWNEYNATAYAV